MHIILLVFDRKDYLPLVSWAVGWMCMGLKFFRIEFSYSQIIDNMAQPVLKEGAVSTFQLLQNTTIYQLRLSLTPKGLWVCVEEAGSLWKLTISEDLIKQTVSKASTGKQTMTLKELSTHLLIAIGRANERWGIGLMTPVELQVLRGGAAAKQMGNSKLYLILSDKEKKFHYPFTLPMQEQAEQEKLTEAIKTMQAQLQQLRLERSDKSQSSFSILSETYGQGEQLKMENEEMKRKIKLYEESLTQKRGAVEIDIILKERNNLQLQAETKRRQENRQIARLKNVHQMMDRQVNDVRTEIENITKQLLLIEDSTAVPAKLKSHAMKVLKSYQNELRTQKKVQQKQIKQLEAAKRNILTSKANERKAQAKIKQIQGQIEQMTKKANIKEISNRLHSVGKNSSNGSNSSKEQSIASSNGKGSSNASREKNNLVRDNLLKRNQNVPTSSQNRQLLRTSPHIGSAQKPSPNKTQTRAINSSYQPKPAANTRLSNTQGYRTAQKSQNENSVRSDSGEKRQATPEEREKQKQAMNRLTGPKLNAMAPRIPPTAGVKAPSSQPQKPVKKDGAKQLLSKMREIKAHYNGQASKGNMSKNTNARISDIIATQPVS